MERQDYEKSVLEYQDVQEAIAYAKELAAKSAFEKGMEKGVEQEKFLIAKKMIENGFDISAVVKIIGLTDVEVLNILKEHNN